MQSQQIALVQQSFQRIQPITEVAAELFYRRLFELDPSLRVLFRGDMKRQGRMLMQMVAVAVYSLSRPHELLPVVRSLGRRHTGYGVKREHYDTVGAALIWTLGHALGADFTPDMEAAWVATYATLAEAMQDISAEPLPIELAA